MKLGPRAKLLILAALFASPVVASLLAYHFLRPAPTANYGELILPPSTMPGHADFDFKRFNGRWLLIASDSGACPEACRRKLTAMRQVRLALGRNASRVARVLVVDDLVAPDMNALAPFDGMEVVVKPHGLSLAPGPANDRGHVYLADPLGNVMMRWPADPDYRGMLKDLERLLKASQIG